MRRSAHRITHQRRRERDVPLPILHQRLGQLAHRVSFIAQRAGLDQHRQIEPGDHLEVLLLAQRNRLLTRRTAKQIGQHQHAIAGIHAADSSETILAFVAAGVGFSLVPSPLEKGPHVAGVVAFPLERPKAVFPIHALWKRRVLPHPLVQAALKVL